MNKTILNATAKALFYPTDKYIEEQLDLEKRTSAYFHFSNIDTIKKSILNKYIHNTSTNDEYFAKMEVLNHYDSIVVIFCLNPRTQCAFYEKVNKNIFLTPKSKQLIYEYNAKIMRTIRAFKRLAQYIIFRKSIVRVNTDLYMSELDPNSKYTYQLVQERNIYYFSLGDLTKLIIAAITHTSPTFCYNDPNHIKNPYNNMLLRKTDLYNIYFRVLDAYIKVPKMLRLFFECEFNINMFKYQHETELREYNIDQHVKSLPRNNLVRDIFRMIQDYDDNCVLDIDPEFPDDMLIKAMMPYLRDHYVILYSMDQSKCDYVRMRLKAAFTKFVNRHPFFGQLIMAPDEDPSRVFGPDGPRPPTVNLFGAPVITAPIQEYNIGYMEYRPRYTMHYMLNHVYDDNQFNRYVIHGEAMETYLSTQTPIRYTTRPNTQPNNNISDNITVDGDNDSFDGSTIASASEAEADEEEIDDTFDD